MGCSLPCDGGDAKLVPSLDPVRPRRMLDDPAFELDLPPDPLLAQHQNVLAAPVAQRPAISPSETPDSLGSVDGVVPVAVEPVRPVVALDGALCRAETNGPTSPVEDPDDVVDHGMMERGHCADRAADEVGLVLPVRDGEAGRGGAEGELERARAGGLAPGTGRRIGLAERFVERVPRHPLQPIVNISSKLEARTRTERTVSSWPGRNASPVGWTVPRRWMQVRSLNSDRTMSETSACPPTVGWWPVGNHSFLIQNRSIRSGFLFLQLYTTARCDTTGMS